MDAFQQLRNRRMKIMEELPSCKNKRQRLSSAQRRHLIQNNINQFHDNSYASRFYKTTNNYNPFNTSRNTNDNLIDKSINQKQQQSKLQQEQSKKHKTHTQFYKHNNNQLQQSYSKNPNQILDSPSIKDILKNYQQQKQKHKQHKQFQAQNKFQNNNPKQHQTQILPQNIQKQQQNLNDNNDNVEFLLSHSSQHKNSTPNPSLFQKINQFNNNALNLNQIRQSNFKPKNINNNLIDSNYPNNNLSSVADSNNSSAILFTSQFHQYINQAHQTIDFNLRQNDKKNIIKIQKQFQDLSQNNNNDSKNNNNKSFQKYEKEQQKKMRQQDNKKNELKQQQIINSTSRPLLLNQSKSGKLFSQSNQQSLKYSMNQSALNQIVNKKLLNQLFLDRQHFYLNQNKISYFALKLLRNQNIQHFKQFSLFAKIYNLHRFQLNLLKRIGFQQLQINYYQSSQQQKHQAFIIILEKRRKQKLLKQIFEQFKFQTKLPKLKADLFQKQKEELLLNNTFRFLKMNWYDRMKVASVDKYYLNKIFLHFKMICQKQKKKSNKKALKFYYKNALRRYFNLFAQGVYNSKYQRQKIMIADDNYALTLMMKTFNAWRQRTSNKGGKYISLAMTTKDIFKETADHRWIQTKTLDFKYIK